ncbi:MAG: aspartate/glutamate racemase family protein [Blastocatellia bacterium]|nr:aspartate/glutamate racemase family protein [Blastocatellia bacterium]
MLGIIDWGIGGVSIYKVVKEQLGDLPVLYFSDTGVTPYGKMARRELADRLDAVIEFLKAKGATRIVIGCNAASTAIGDLADHGIPIKGVIEPAVGFASRLKPKRLGLIGGRRTVVSGVYRRAFSERNISIEQRVAQPLSGLIESGDISSDRLRSEAKRILSPLKNCSHILLACTHYPAISDVLADFVSPNTKLIDPAAEMVKIVSKWRLANGNAQFFTSGDAIAMKRSAKNAFGVSIKNVKKVTL